MLISQIEEVGADVGEPDCKLIAPYQTQPDGSMFPFLWEYTEDREFMISSDKILTIADPKSNLLENYLQLIEE